MPCGMFNEPAVSLLDKPFMAAWREIVVLTEKLSLYSECCTCKYKPVCRVCGAGCYTEGAGDMSKKPEYLCEMARVIAERTKEIALKKEDL